MPDPNILHEQALAELADAACSRLDEAKAYITDDKAEPARECLDQAAAILNLRDQQR